MKSGIELITEERNRQIFDLGYDAKHDAEHNNHELVIHAIQHLTRYRPIYNWDDGDGLPAHIKDLIQAGALIAAEIDRLQGPNKD